MALLPGYPSRRSIRIFAAFILSAYALLTGTGAHANGDAPISERSWVASWSTASKVPSPFDGPTPAFNDTTLRQIVRVSLGGWRARVWLTNEFGTEPLVIGSARLGLRDQGSAVQAGSDRKLTFGGNNKITIAPGAKVVSDPVYLPIANQTDLAVSIHLPQDLSAQTSPTTYHVRALQTSYIATGNQTAAPDLVAADTTTAWFYLAGVDVLTWGTPLVIVGYGDSTTDGDQMAAPNEPVDQNGRYTNFLAQLLQRGPNRAAIVNQGISGNQVTSTFIGENLQARFDRDVLAQTGVTHLVTLGGINDIGLPVLLGAPMGASAEAIIAGLAQVNARARVQGIITICGTITPAGSSPLPGYSGPQAEATRSDVNSWIRSGGSCDLVADFDQALRDTEDPTVMRADLTADGLHPNSAGYRLMAQVVADLLR